MLRAVLDKWATVELIEPIVWKHAKLPIWGPTQIMLRVSTS